MVVADIDREAAARVANEVDGIAVTCDVTDPNHVKALMERATEAYGGIDVLHNNAGSTDLAHTTEAGIDTLPMDVWHRMIDLNLTAPFLCVRAALPSMRGRPGANIINAGSVAGMTGRRNTLAYGAAKAGLAQLTRTLAVELAKDSIRVNAYAPGVVETDLARAFIVAQGDLNVVRDSILTSYLVDDLGQADDVAALVCFLASPQAKFINGAVVNIDGGFLAHHG